MTQVDDVKQGEDYNPWGFSKATPQVEQQPIVSEKPVTATIKTETKVVEVVPIVVSKAETEVP